MGAGAPLWIGAVIGALIAAVVTALGWWVSHARDRTAAERARQSKIVDLQKALRAEIVAHLHQLARWAAQGGGQETIAAILQAGDAPATRFTPLLPAERHDRMFAALVDEIHVLDTDVVAPVVAYYHQLAMVADLADMIRTPDYAEISAERRAKAYAYYVTMKIDAREMGEDALGALDAAIAKAAPNPYFFSS